LRKWDQETERFIDELHWLLEDQLPPGVKKRIQNDDKEAKKILYSGVKPCFKVIISLREDYLPDFMELKSKIPSIDRSFFRVNHLNGKQAQEVIKAGFSEESVPLILRYFYPEDNRYDIPEDKLEVEPVFLSLLCHQLYGKQPLISTYIVDEEKILENFYDSKLSHFPGKVKTFIEDKLLTARGFRTPFYLDPSDPLRDHINHLVDDRVLRKFHHEKEEYVEIIHDVLSTIVKEQRNQRLDKIHKKQLKRRMAVRFILATAIIASILAFYAFYQKSRADAQYRLAQMNRLTSEALLEFPKNNTKAIRIAEEAIKRSPKYAEASSYKALSEIGYSSYHQPFYLNIYPVTPGDAIYSAVFSADNQHILTAHEDGSAYIRDLDGKSLLSLKGHTGRITSAVYSPDKKLILTASWDKTARLWDKDGKQSGDPLKHDGIVSCASFSPDGNYVLTASYDNTARLWDVKGNPLQIFRHQGKVIAASFSPDGNYILTASWDKTAKVWNREGGLLFDLKRHTDTLSSAVFSPDGRFIVTGSWDRRAILWDDKGNFLAAFDHDSPVVYTLFSPDGKLILTASLDGTLKLWNRENSGSGGTGNHKPIAEIKHEGILSTVLFSPGGDTILTACEDGIIKLWDLQGNRRTNIDKHNQIVRAAAFSPDGHYLFTSSQGENSILWDFKSNILVSLRHNQQVTNAIFSPDGKSILTTADDGIARLWDDTGKYLTSLKHDKEIISTLFTSNADQILTASNDGTIKVWDRNGIGIQTFGKEYEQLNSAIFSEDGKWAFTISSFGKGTLWNLQGETPPQIPTGEVISKALIAPKAKNLLTISRDNEKAPDYQGNVVRLLDLSKGNTNPPKSFTQKNIAGAVFSSDGNRILIASKAGEAVIRDLSGKIRNRFNLEIKDKELISAVLSPGGDKVLTILNDGPSVLSDLKGKELATFKHDGHINTAVFSPDGKQILTASMDKTAKLWDLKGNLLATFTHDGAVISAVFSFYGKVVTASHDKTVKVWLTPPAILEWLKNSKIPQLTEEDNRVLKISF
jgi:WD40 repeat protein